MPSLRSWSHFEAARSFLGTLQLCYLNSWVKGTKWSDYSVSKCWYQSVCLFAFAAMLLVSLFVKIHYTFIIHSVIHLFLLSYLSYSRLVDITNSMLCNNKSCRTAYKEVLRRRQEIRNEKSKYFSKLTMVAPPQSLCSLKVFQRVNRKENSRKCLRWTKAEVLVALAWKIRLRAKIQFDNPIPIKMLYLRLLSVT